MKIKTLFLIDGLGALLSAFFLFAVLGTFSEYFGMSPTILIRLSAIAMIFALYSMTCFFFLKDNWKPFLRIICAANLLYSCLTISLVIYFYKNLTLLGIAYFLAEIIVILGLVFVELKALNDKNQNNGRKYEIICKKSKLFTPKVKPLGDNG
jgi:hypothetical protein